MHKQRSGFTLIEVLIVIVIIAIITAIAVLSLGHLGQSRRENAAVEQFTDTIAAALQQAILTPMALGLSITPTGYRYFEYTAAAWVPLKNDVLSHASAFQSVFTVEIKTIHAAAPSILFSPSGYVTPFVVNLTGSTHTYAITVKNNGSTQVTVHEKE